jgi:hypothetical protein
MRQRGAQDLIGRRWRKCGQSSNWTAHMRVRLDRGDNEA